MSRRGWQLFIVMSILWGTPYLLIKVAVAEMSPASLVFARTAIAAAILMPLAVMRGHLRLTLPRWRPLVAFSLIGICLPWLMLGYAEQRLSSSLTGLLVAAVPLAGAVLSKITGHEALGTRNVTGLLVGFAGVVVLIGFDIGPAQASAVVAVAVVVVCYAVAAFILSRYLRDLPGLGVVAPALLLAAVLYAPVGMRQMPASPAPETWLSVLALAVVCTGIGFVLYFRLIAEVGPARANVMTYVHPAVALVLGVAVLNESVSVATGVGFVLILYGSVIATSRATKVQRQTL